jgi:Kef-type K+ transport system membrane component KefB
MIASETAQFQDLVVLLSLAVIAPLLTQLARRISISAVVLEILLGMLVGPQLLGWVSTEGVIESFAAFGLAMLFFLAGFEVDFSRLVGAPLRQASIGWFGSLAVALAIGGVLALSGVVIDSLVVGLCLTTTALGALLPILRDQGDLHSPFGERVTANGALGEFGPIVAIALLFAGGNPAIEGLLLIGFFLLVGIALALTRRFHVPWVHDLLRRGLRSSNQLPVRLCLLLVAVLVWIASSFGLDMLLGAFAAGVVVRFAVFGDGETGADAQLFGEKLEGIGFGIFIPIFFVSTGVAFDLEALFSSTTTLLKVPMFLGLILLARAVPVYLAHRSAMPKRDLTALALYTATALPLIVAITHIGVETDRMRPENATALVAAGMLSVLVFPVIAGQLRAGSTSAPHHDAAVPA